MAAFFSNLRNTVFAGFGLAFIVFLIYIAYGSFNNNLFWPFLLRWLHIGSGVMWIGLLWYFNFVQTPTMPKIPDELKGGVSRFIAPAALFWFRWGAMATLIFGIALAALYGELVDGYTLNILDGFINLRILLIGIGMWLGTIMWFNVWFVIWPNQKKILGIVAATDEQKAKARKTALYASRINFILSVPMLMCMGGQGHGLPF